MPFYKYFEYFSNTYINHDLKFRDDWLILNDQTNSPDTGGWCG